MKDLVTFNVGGSKHQVTRSLLEMHSSTMLAKSASEQWMENPDATIFIDRDGELFRHVLNYLRDNQVVLPITVARQTLINELEYYGVNCDIATIQVCSQASALSALSVNKLIESLEKDELSIRLTKVCIEKYKASGQGDELQFFVRQDCADKTDYISAECVSEGGKDMLDRCNNHLQSFGLVLKSVAGVEVFRQKPKFSVLLQLKNLTYV